MRVRLFARPQEGKRDGALLIVNDKKLQGPMRVRLWLGGDEDMQ